MLVLPLLVAAPSQLDAQRPGFGGVQIEAFRGIYFPEDLEFRLGENAFQLDDNRAIFGARVGYTFLPGLFLEGSFAYTPLRFRRGSTLTNLNTFMFDGAVGYKLELTPAARLRGLAGIGFVQWLPDGVVSSVESLEAVFGVGFSYHLTSSLALRADFRDHIVPKTLTDLRERLNPELEFDPEGTHNFEISASLSFFVPVHSDRDGDGVFDRYDICPATPAGVSVDGRGCPLDSDEDGVPNHQDRCAATPPGTDVGPDGCEPDRDGDGVGDVRDRCPDTPAGAPVDATGCVRDADADGVHDELDACPGTPAAVPVDDEGCVLDGDGDGVHDGRDRCPSTPSGQPVNADGCSAIEAGLEAGRLVLSSVQFTPGGSDLLLRSREVLDQVGRALLARPGLRVEIRGHTDDTGSALSNLQLSEARAQAVFDYLVSTFSALDRDRFVVRGWGESQPIASNETEEGRAQNRRVEFVVLRDED